MSESNGDGEFESFDDIGDGPDESVTWKDSKRLAILRHAAGSNKSDLSSAASSAGCDDRFIVEDLLFCDESGRFQKSEEAGAAVGTLGNPNCEKPRLSEAAGVAPGGTDTAGHCDANDENDAVSGADAATGAPKGAPNSGL